jgi:gamma-glutamyltranspeptidase/glutathione hydrolase
VPFTYASRRSPVFARRGIVATSQPLAAQAGIDILALGGSAADAAIATAAALNVTEPTSTGIGGDCFALYYDAETREITALNGSGRAPGELTLDLLEAEGFGESLPALHAHTVTVPGACAGWSDLLERHGRVGLKIALAPAINLAEDGFPVSPLTSYFWERGVERQLKNASSGEELTINGRAPKPGEIFKNPGLARTLRAVGEGGAKAFYEGEIAEAIARAVRNAGGLLSERDMSSHRSTWDEAISVTYRGLRVWEAPPNGQGLVALLALKILEGYDLESLDALSPSRLHLVIEALRLAFADGNWFVADPDFVPIPLEVLLSDGYAERRRTLIDRKHATQSQPVGIPAPASDTVYLSVIDEEGNACSFINSNYMGFGTGIVPQGWGFSLQNRGAGFSLDREHPNALAPGKRPYHTIIPGMVTRDDGSLYSSFGVMGGFMQPQGHVQVLTGLIDDGLDPQAALDRPRVNLAEARPGSPVSLEEGLPDETVTELAAMGHEIEVVTGQMRAMFGRGQVILRDDETGVLCGGSDPRADGCAVPLA